MNLVALQQLHRDTEETEKEKKENVNAYAFLIAIYSIYRHLVYTPSSSHMPAHSMYDICAAHPWFHVPRSVLHPCMYTHVYMHFLCMHLSAYPTTTHERVLPHNTPRSTVYLQPQRSQLLAGAEPFLSQLPLSKQHKEITVLPHFLVIPTPPHSVKRLFSPKRVTNNMLLS